MNTQNKHLGDLFEDEHVDDYNTLNYLIEHVHGLRPSSLIPELTVYDEELLTQ